MEAKWYTVYTKSQTEKKVLDTLVSKKFEAYLPINRIGNTWNDKRFKEEPLFKSYVFIKAKESELKEIKKISCVVNVVYWLGQPVVVSDKEINLIMRFLNDHLNVTLQKNEIGNSFYNSGDNGSFLHCPENTAVENRIANAVIPSLGFVLQAKAEKTNVTVISENFTRKTKFTSYNLFNKVAEFNATLRVNW